MPEAVSLTNPPIIERILGVYRRIPQAGFELKLPAWSERIHAEYPIPEPVSEWTIEIEEKDGVPLIKSLGPKARLIHVFWQHHPKGHHVKGMRLRPDRLVFHLLREEKNPHSFEEIYPEMEKWLPIWANHFGVTNLDGVTLEYVNMLGPKTTPQFVNPDGTLRVSEILNVFSTFPGPNKGFTNPFDCRARVILNDKKTAMFDVRVRGLEDGTNEVRVDFNLRVFPGAGELSLSGALEELRKAHEIMLEQFSCLFTGKAIESFA